MVMVTGELATTHPSCSAFSSPGPSDWPSRPASRARWIEDLRALSMPDGPFGQVAQPAILMELLDLLGERLAALERPVCLMIDGIAPTVAHGVFGSLRNELWALEGAAWIVAGDISAEALYLEPPADAFFEQTIRLGRLTDADAAKLLGAHLPDLTDADIKSARRWRDTATRDGCCEPPVTSRPA